MPKPIHDCECEQCQSGVDHAERAHHRRMNVFLSRLDEQERRWYAGLEAERYGWGGTHQIAELLAWMRKQSAEAEQSWLRSWPFARRIAFGPRVAVVRG